MSSGENRNNHSCVALSWRMFWCVFDWYLSALLWGEQEQSLLCCSVLKNVLVCLWRVLTCSPVGRTGTITLVLLCLEECSSVSSMGTYLLSCGENRNNHSCVSLSWRRFWCVFNGYLSALLWGEQEQSLLCFSVLKKVLVCLQWVLICSPVGEQEQSLLCFSLLKKVLVCLRQVLTCYPALLVTESSTVNAFFCWKLIVKVYGASNRGYSWLIC